MPWSTSPNFGHDHDGQSQRGTVTALSAKAHPAIGVVMVPRRGVDSDAGGHQGDDRHGGGGDTRVR
jgi:hypothetical protein